MRKISINLAGLELKNPVILASGIAGFGEEYFDLVDLNVLGGFITKTITLLPKKGNPPPRIFETNGGIVNSIGLENPGLERFIKEKLPFIKKKFKIPVIVSVGGDSEDEYTEIVQRLESEKGISGFELNLS
ncbi:MAG: dihydroorotate dehydrogenase, partial [Endomicrobiia bacterium]